MAVSKTVRLSEDSKLSTANSQRSVQQLSGASAQSELRVHTQVEERLDVALDAIRAYYKDNGVSPSKAVAKAKLGLATIIERIDAEEFKDEDILSYYDLVRRAGVPVGMNPGIWATVDGLKIGIERIKTFSTEHNGRAPTHREARVELGLQKLIFQIETGAFKGDGLSSYTMLLLRADLKPSEIEAKGYRKTEEGLIDAKERIVWFYKEHGRLPNVGEALHRLVLFTFIDEIRNGNFRNIGVYSYVGFLAKLKQEKLIPMQVPYSELAIEQYREAVVATKRFHLINGRAPKERELTDELGSEGFLTHLQHGAYIGRGLRGFNDFLRKLEMEPSREAKGTWVAKSGLDMGAELLRGFYEEKKRIPKYREASEFIQGLLINIRAGRFASFGVRDYEDMLAYAGLTVHEGAQQPKETAPGSGIKLRYEHSTDVHSNSGITNQDTLSGPRLMQRN